MTIRNIVKIDEQKCNGCGQCVTACAEGAIAIINGKAKLVSEIYCDGLGDCLAHCPQDAITIEKRDVKEFSEDAVKKHLAPEVSADKIQPFTCPGLMAKTFSKKDQKPNSQVGEPGPTSQLAHWPVQLKLISPNAPFLKNAHLVFVADCVAFAMGDFHNKFLKDQSVAIACPKLDDTTGYIEKLAEIIQNSDLKSLTVVHMIVPCCSKMTNIARAAIEISGVDLPIEDVTISLEGDIISSETMAKHNFSA